MMVKKLIWKLLPACILAGGLLFGVIVLLARADTPIVDLSEGEENYRVVGETALDWMGEMTTGDVNADGIPDLIVGASGYDVPGYDNAGAVYVIFGSPSLSGTLDLNDSAEDADIVIYGHQANSAVGHVVASGDLNGDEYADIVIGASAFSYGARAYAGAVFVIYGPITETLTAPIYLSDTEQVGLTIYGQAAVDRFGRAVAVGDVNGDGVDDLVGAAYWADRLEGNDSGRAYVFYGSEALTGTIDLDTTPADVTIIGAEAGDYLGRSVATGDVNGDGAADLIIGVYYAGPGEVALIYGSDTLSSTIDLRTDNITGQGLGLLFRGVHSDDGAGFYVTSGNINGDQNQNTGKGYADILVGAYREGLNEDGIGYALYGGSEVTAGVTITSGTWTVPISICADLTLYPANAGDRLGRSVASGDLNADGYDDFIIGASRADLDDRTNAGEAYVFYGSPHLSGTLTISPTGNTDLTVLGDRANDEVGRSTAAGDLNGDGVPDLIVGAVMAVSEIGEVYVIWGPSADAISITASTDVITAGQAITFTVIARNHYGQTWDVTDYTTTYTTLLAAGGTWDQNSYTSEVAGVWVITAAHQGLTATTVITVTPNVATTLDLTPPSASLVAGDSITYTVIATDTYGNSWEATETAAYAIDPDAGGGWDVYTYTGELAGSWVVTAAVDSVATTATLTVTSGVLDYITLSPAVKIITAGQTQTYTVEAFDAYTNSLGEVTDSAEYTVTLAAGGVWTDNIYTSDVVGIWTVTSTYEGRSVTATLTVTPITHFLTIATTGIGSGVVSPTVGVHIYEYNTLVTMTAEADIGSIFDGWSGDIQSMDNPYLLMIDGPKVVTATFTHPITRSVVATGVISFDPLPVIIVVEDRGNCLTEISVTQFEQNHPYATTDNLRTGRYWQITQEACGPSEVFTATLNVPLGSVSPYDSPKLCRWADPVWDCAEETDHIVGTDSITRTNIHAFSLWTVGYNVSPTVLAVSGLTGRGAASTLMFGGLFVLFVVEMYLTRKRQRR